MGFYQIFIQLPFITCECVTTYKSEFSSSFIKFYWTGGKLTVRSPDIWSQTPTYIHNSRGFADALSTFQMGISYFLEELASEEVVSDQKYRGRQLSPQVSSARKYRVNRTIEVCWRQNTTKHCHVGYHH